jgi:uncharacterized protein (DUF2236 family)
VVRLIRSPYQVPGAHPLFPTEDELDDILVGPDSVTWRTTSDARLHLVMLYPLLLQVAHPTVGAGVRDYSDFQRRPWNRLLRTVQYVSLLVYGGRDAVPAGRRLRALHGGFRGIREDGKPYHALEPDAYAWVHATLIDTYVSGHAHFGKPMTRTKMERFYREYRRLGRLIGVRDRDLPEDWAGFREYFDRTKRDVLVPTPSVATVLETVSRVAPPFPLPGPIWRTVRLPARRALWLGGVGLIDAPLRYRLGIHWSALDEAQFRALARLSRGLTPIMPERLRVMGPGQLKPRRRTTGEDPLGEAA